MNEFWITLKKHPQYEISNQGNIRDKTSRQQLPFIINSDGYKTVPLLGSNKKYILYKLVAEYFIERPEGKKYLTHMDNDKLNDRVENLKWISMSERLWLLSPKGNISECFPGVYFHKRDKRWEASMIINKKKHYFGRFDTFDEAVNAKRHGEIELFGHVLQYA